VLYSNIPTCYFNILFVLLKLIKGLCLEMSYLSDCIMENSANKGTQY
jgi:hypothetical protein